ncbi:MAG: GNAT family N-acetyltransferase [Desulfofustis sp.]|nr:GNAT family N-acetyltransferase [Desulfofustis sp.]
MQNPRHRSSITAETIDFSAFEKLWQQYGSLWEWDNPFITPPWLKVWHRVFGGGREPLLTLVSNSGNPIGIAPLMTDGATARIIGSADLCDSGDVVVAPHEEHRFFSELWDFLESRQINRLVLEPVRPDSIVYSIARAAERSERWRCTITPLSQSLEMELPGSWQEYLDRLSSKQRHEVRRKLRRLHESGEVVMSKIGGAEQIDAAMKQFIELFRLSRKDKAAFMNNERERFFRLLAAELDAAGMLRLQEITINNVSAAIVFCIEHANCLYLYNNGYNPEYRATSIGLLSKVLSIRAAIEAQLATYDFLGGIERYKYQLGGAEITLYSCVFECVS